MPRLKRKLQKLQNKYFRLLICHCHFLEEEADALHPFAHLFEFVLRVASFAASSGVRIGALASAVASFCDSVSSRSERHALATQWPF